MLYFFRQKTAYELRISDWSSDVCSSDLYPRPAMSAEDRLRWYARFFDCVEVTSTYYALPSPRNAALWAARTPPGFLFHVKVYSLMTRSEAPRVGKRCVSTCTYRRSPSPSQTKTSINTFYFTQIHL